MAVADRQTLHKFAYRYIYYFSSILLAHLLYVRHNMHFSLQITYVFAFLIANVFIYQTLLLNNYCSSPCQSFTIFVMARLNSILLTLHIRLNF